MSLNHNRVQRGTAAAFREQLGKRLRAVKTRTGEALPKIAERIPETTKEGFRKGRVDGRKFVEHGIPRAVGYGAGFGFGATEAIVGVLAKPANCLVGVGLGLGAWAARAIGIGCRGENEEYGCDGQVEVA